MDAHKQPGIKFLGTDLVSINFALRGALDPRIRYGIKFQTQCIISDDKKHLDIMLATDLFGDLPSDNKPPIDFKFVHHARFEVVGNESMPLDEFAKFHAAANLMPYVRELVTNITSRSVLPTLNIGPINLIALSETGQADFVLHEEKKKLQQT